MACRPTQTTEARHLKSIRAIQNSVISPEDRMTTTSNHHSWTGRAETLELAAGVKLFVFLQRYVSDPEHTMRLSWAKLL